jgi:hypothetical protein
MSASTKSRYEGMTRVRQVFPLTGKGPTAVSHLVLKILETDKYVQRVILEVGKPVQIETLVPSDSPLADTEQFHDLIRAKPMVEYAPEAPSKSPYEILFAMFQQVTAENLEVAFVLAGNLLQFNRWVKNPMRSNKVYGVPLYAIQHVPADVFFVCGAEVQDADPKDIELSIKGNMS